MKFDLTAQSWPLLQRVLFRFFFQLFFWLVSPFYFLEGIPGANYLLEWIYKGMTALSELFNEWFFHISPATKPPNGNGDYPEQWMMVGTALVLTVLGTLIWSIADRRRRHYQTLNYWLCLGLRYFLIANGLSYGIIKLFALQMPFPNLSQMATPLGDYLPMRFSWMFVGYSTSYQMFSGGIELLAAVLLLFRRTATLGVLVAAGVFLNVMMLNLSYDIPVKINSIQLVVVCLYLLAQELPRLIAFFFRNEAHLSRIFTFPFETLRGRRIARIGKWLYVGVSVGMLLSMAIQQYQNDQQRPQPKPIRAGIYDVLKQTLRGDTLGVADSDSVYWQNVVFDRGYEGSIKTTDARFRQRYGRGYFSFEIDSTQKVVSLKRTKADSVVIVRFSFMIKDSTTLELRSYPHADSLYVLLRRRTKPFPLSERQFHWISETNR